MQTQHFSENRHYKFSTRDAKRVAEIDDQMGHHPARLIPKLSFAKARGIGWH